jgi:hypothetical protein
MDDLQLLLGEPDAGVLELTGLSGIFPIAGSRAEAFAVAA